MLKQFEVAADSVGLYFPDIALPSLILPIG